MYSNKIKAERKITGKFDVLATGEDLRILMQDKSSFFLLDNDLLPVRECKGNESLESEKIKDIALHPSLEKFVFLTENTLHSISFSGEEKEYPVEGGERIKYSPDGQHLWCVEYMSDKQFRVSVRDAHSFTLLATDIYEDELYRSHFMLTHLPEHNRINLHQAAGQDGSMNSFLTYCNGTIQMDKISQLDEAIVPEFRKDKKEFVIVLYPEGFATFTYPECENVFSYEVDHEKEEYSGFQSFYLNDNQIVYDINEYLWQIFDLKEKTKVGPFIIEEHEPKEAFHYFPRLKDDTDLITNVYSLRPYGKYIVGQYSDDTTEEKPSFLFILEN